MVAGFCLALPVGLVLAAPIGAAEVVITAGEHDADAHSGSGPLEGGVVVRLTGIEMWRSRRGLVLVPAFGAMMTELDTSYGWAGAALQIPLGSRWGLVPELGVGAYQRGDGKNLGGSLQFRSGLELTRRRNDGAQVGVGFYHLSNGGLSKPNPGVNSLVLTVGVGRFDAFRRTPTEEVAP